MKVVGEFHPSRAGREAEATAQHHARTADRGVGLQVAGAGQADDEFDDDLTKPVDVPALLAVLDER